MKKGRYRLRQILHICRVLRSFIGGILLTGLDYLVIFAVLTFLIDAFVNVLKLLVVIKHDIFVPKVLMLREWAFESGLRCNTVWNQTVFVSITFLFLIAPMLLLDVFIYLHSWSHSFSVFPVEFRVNERTIFRLGFRLFFFS